jgi:hypothetical protein
MSKNSLWPTSNDSFRDNEGIKPPVTEYRNDSPLLKYPSPSKQSHSEDCISETIDFVKIPLFFGFLWGATKASIQEAPKIVSTPTETTNPHGIKMVLRGIAKELKYLKGPVLAWGGFAALYSLVSCSVEKLYYGKDNYWSSAFGGFVTGLAAGIYLRDPNKTVLLATYGAGLAAISKHFYNHPYLKDHIPTYHGYLEARKLSMRPEFREAAADGYLHHSLDPALERAGVVLPNSWKKEKQ